MGPHTCMHMTHAFCVSSCMLNSLCLDNPRSSVLELEQIQRMPAKNREFLPTALHPAPPMKYR